VLNLFCHLGAGSDEVRNESLVDVQMTLVLAQIALVVPPGEYAPDLRPESQRLGQCLEYDEALVRRPVAMPSQRGQAQGMGRVIGEIESALQRKRAAASIFQARQARPQQAGKLVRPRRLAVQHTGAAQPIKVR
jgi:hypothetical protein